MDDDNETLQERIKRLMGERGLNVNSLTRESRQTLSNVYSIVKEGRIPRESTVLALAEVLDPEGKEDLLFYRHVEELIELKYERPIAKAAVRLSEADPEGAGGIARLCESDPQLAAEVLSIAERFAEANEQRRAEFLEGIQELAEDLEPAEPGSESRREPAHR